MFIRISEANVTSNNSIKIAYLVNMSFKVYADTIKWHGNGYPFGVEMTVKSKESQYTVIHGPFETEADALHYARQVQFDGYFQVPGHEIKLLKVVKIELPGTGPYWVPGQGWKGL